MPFTLINRRPGTQRNLATVEAELLQTRSTIERMEHEAESARIASRKSDGILDALSRSFAVIEFEMDGTIIAANQNFQQTMGYTEEEVVGQHHRLFVDPEYGQTAAYRELWERLRRGEFVSGEFHRVAKGGRNIWLRAAYNPILDENGRAVGVIKFALDVTKDKMTASDYEYQLEAVRRTQAVIEFNVDGTIITANDNFLSVVGYRLDEIQGHHHKMFVDPEYARSSAYAEFWKKLQSGQNHSGQFKRLSKRGNEIWIEASYNPIFDPAGNLVKVVKFATDITKEVEARQESSRTAETLASSFAEMTATITEISRNVNNVTNLANHTQTLMDATGETIDGLGDSSRRIGDVVSLISKFAEQTNLLALNASVEAARAGDAGRGFAVVATEVKSLAIETRKATEMIEESVKEIRGRISQVVESADQIRNAVGDVNQNIGGVAVAIEQQSATMNHLQKSAGHLT